MKKTILLLLFIVFTIQTKAQTPWEVLIPYPLAWNGNLIKTNDDNVVFSLFSSDDFSSKIFKYNTDDGSLIWEQPLLDNQNNYYTPRKIIETSDGGFLLTKRYSSTNSLIKLDSNGILVNQSSTSVGFGSLVETDNYYVVRQNYDVVSQNYELYYYDKQLNFSHINAINYNNYFLQGGFLLKNNNNQLFSWFSNGLTSDLQGKAYLTNELSTAIQFENIINFNKIDDIKNTLDNGFIFASGWQDCCFDYHQGSVIKLDTQLNIEWANDVHDFYMIPGVAHYEYPKILATQDGQYIFAGTIGNDLFDAVLITKIDENGNRVWRSDHPLYRYVYGIIETEDNGLVLLVTDDNVGNSSNVYLIKTNAYGSLSTGNTNMDKNTLNIYPNPTKDSINIKFNKLFYGTITIHNVLAQKIISLPINSTLNKKIDLSKFKDGVYILKISDTNNNHLIKKIIKQ